mmetsp:Transcript_71854/g.215985  ORF Transcript_71854/g.215985 Transcript_71854/m.215985 type:complete len:202 (-) Transcript_71854:139-744(-)
MRSRRDSTYIMHLRRPDAPIGLDEREYISAGTNHTAVRLQTPTFDAISVGHAEGDGIRALKCDALVSWPPAVSRAPAAPLSAGRRLTILLIRLAPPLSQVCLRWHGRQLINVCAARNDSIRFDSIRRSGGKLSHVILAGLNLVLLAFECLHRSSQHLRSLKSVASLLERCHLLQRHVHAGGGRCRWRRLVHGAHAGFRLRG